ncbi:DUF4347 domain-containing protein [Marinobacterium stanieri]|uniref:DUF4347 domain-containing protein n=1 Tax=Marinobacterium stanieri TaxID=49186 RepID=UPI003A8E9D45
MSNLKRREVAVIDTSLADYQVLLDDAVKQGMEIIRIAGTDGWGSLAQQLEGAQDIDALHIFSHGNQGEVLLGQDILSSETLAQHAEVLDAIKQSLSENGDVLLYGCDIASGDGQYFISDLAQTTGADVAASDDATGAAHLGGDWELEFHYGEIETPVAISSYTQENYDHLLATFGFSTSSGSGTVTETVNGVTLSAYTTTGNLTTWDQKLFDNANSAKYLKFTFSTTVDVSSFQIGFVSNSGTAGDFQITGSSSQASYTYNTNPTYSNLYNQLYTVNLSGANDWGGVDTIQVTNLGSGTVQFMADNIVFTVVDAIPPDLTVDLLPSSDTGSSNSDHITNQVNPTITYLTESGATVEIDWGDGNGYQSAAAGTGGTQTATYSTGYSTNGAKTITVRSTDAANNSITKTVDITLDLIAPASPSTPDLAASSDTGASSTDNQTSDNTPTLTGTAESGSTVEVFSDGSSLGTTTSTGGTWTFTPGSNLAEGAHTITAKATDTAGNTSGASSGLSITIDTTAPSAPSIASMSTDTGTSAGDGITTDTTPTLSGSGATANGAVSIYRDNSLQTSVTADGAGNWSYTSPTLGNGTYSFTAHASDTAGNQSLASSSLSVTVDTTPPTVSQVTASTADGAYNAGDTISIQVVFDNVVTVSGTPQLTLETGLADRVASYISGDGTNTLTFNYTVQAGDNTTDLDYLSTSALTLNGGSIQDNAGNTATLTLPSPGAANSLGANTNIRIDTQAPNITQVSIPDTAMKVGQTVNVTITVDDDGGDTYTNLSGTVGGFTLTNFSKNSNTEYTAQFVVTDGGTDVAAGSNIPVSLTLSDTAGNTSLAYTTAISQASDSIDANKPTITNVAIPNSLTKVGDAVNVTVTASESGLSLNSGTINGVAVTGFSDNNDGTYSAIYTVQEGDTDRAAGDDIPVAFVLEDAAGNSSDTYTTSISQGSDAIDANTPVITNVSVPNTAMTVGQTVIVTIIVDDDGGDTYTNLSGTVGGFNLSNLSRTNSTTYTAQFTVTEGGMDVAAGSDIPVSFSLEDSAGNPSNTYTIAISQGSDDLDANSPGTPTGILAVDENSADTTAAGTVSGGGSDGVSYSLTDNAGGRFAIEANTGAVTVADGSLLDHESNANHNITVRATDDAGNATDNTLTVTVNDVNEAATLANFNGDSVSFAIGGNPVTLDASGDAAVADVDSADFDSGNVTASITANGQGTEDALSVGSIGAISLSGSDVVHSDDSGTTIGSVSGGSNGNDLVISLNASATPARVQDLVRALQYTNTDTATTNTAARTVRVTLNDGDGATSAHQDATINLVRAPIIDLDGDDSSGATDEGFAGSFTEGTPAAAADSDSAISDDGSFKSLTVTLTNRPDGAAESLASTYGSGAQTVNSEPVTIGSYDSNTGTLTITVNDSSTDASTLQMLMESIHYNNSSDDPNTSDRVITFSAVDNDDNIGSNATAILNITPVNDAPALTTIGSDPTFTEGGVAASLFTGTSIDAIEAVDNIRSLALTVANLANGSDEKLSVDGESITLTDGTGGTTATGSFSYSVAVSGTTATVTLTKDDSTGSWQTLIDALVFLNSSDTPDTNARTVTLASITDTGGSDNGGSDSTTLAATSSVTIIPVNNAPTIATNSGPSVQTGRTITITTSHLNEGDPDDDGADLTYTLVSLPSGGALQLNSTDLAVNDTFTQKDIDDGLVTFIAGNTSGATTFEISLADGGEDGAVAASDTVSINVTNPPPPPPPAPEPIPPIKLPDQDTWDELPDVDSDGIPEAVEDFVTSPTGVQGDGNGDGVADRDQQDVASVPFRNTEKVSLEPNAEPVFISLTSGTTDGKSTATGSGTRLTNVHQQDKPEDAPDELDMPLGLIAFNAEIEESGGTETFSLYVDDITAVNGYWKQNTAGDWVNLASAEYGGKVVLEGSKLRLDFELTDGGEFDEDGIANGVIVDPGALGFGSESLADQVQALYIAYYQRPADNDGLDFWVDYLNAQDGSLESVVDAFATSAESQALYGDITEANVTQFLIDLYGTLFNRPVDSEGLAFYRNAFIAGEYDDGRPATAGTLMLDILQGAQNSDADLVELKLDSARTFTWLLDPDKDGEVMATYDAKDLDEVRAWLQGLADNDAAPGVGSIHSLIKEDVAGTGEPITLTGDNGVTELLF